MFKVKYNADGWPVNVAAPIKHILDLRDEHQIRLAENRLTWEKLEGMTASEINSRWDEVSSFLTCNKKDGKYE